MKKTKKLTWGGTTNYNNAFQFNSTTQANMANFNNSYYNPQPTNVSLPPIQTEYSFSSFQQQPESGRFGFSPESFDYNATKGFQEQSASQTTGSEESGGGGFPGGGPAWLGTIAKVAGGVTDVASSFSGYKDPGDSNYKTKQAVGDALLMSGNPYAAAAGAAVKAWTFAQRAAGKEVSNINNTQAKAAGINKATQIGNTALDFLTLGTGLDLMLPERSSKLIQSQEAENIRGAYTGTARNIDTASTMANKNYILGIGKINKFVDEQSRNIDLLSQIGIDNEQRVSSVPYNANDIVSRNFKKAYGMTGATRVGKEGMKMLSREELDRIYAAKPVVQSDIQKFENGGSIMIPDGKLHANLHHMEDVNPDLAEDLTKKGIPVVVTDNNGEVTQVAEIEKEEIILEKTLTQKIEDLWKDGSDEAMIEAGKLIVCALLNDSTDNAGLINSVK